MKLKSDVETQRNGKGQKVKMKVKPEVEAENNGEWGDEVEDGAGHSEVQRKIVGRVLCIFYLIFLES